MRDMLFNKLVSDTYGYKNGSENAEEDYESGDEMLPCDESSPALDSQVNNG